MISADPSDDTLTVNYIGEKKRSFPFQSANRKRDYENSSKLTSAALAAALRGSLLAIVP